MADEPRPQADGPPAWVTPPPAWGTPPPAVAPPTPNTPGPYPPPPGVWTPAPYATPARTNGLAVASFVLGLLFWLYAIPAVLALIFGYIAKRQIDDANGTQGGRGLAVAGIVLGWVGVGLVALIMVAVVVALATSG